MAAARSASAWTAATQSTRTRATTGAPSEPTGMATTCAPAGTSIVRAGATHRTARARICRGAALLAALHALPACPAIARIAQGIVAIHVMRPAADIRATGCRCTAARTTRACPGAVAG
jgi:hypothetical protein